MPATVSTPSGSWAHGWCAVEPQPDFVRLLQRRFGGDARVTLLPLALGRAPGQAQLLASLRTPTVSTLSADFVARAGAAASFRGVRWAAGPLVPVTRWMR